MSLINRLIECFSKCNLFIRCKSKCCRGCFDCDCNIIEGNKTPRVNSYINDNENLPNEKITVV